MFHTSLYLYNSWCLRTTFAISLIIFNLISIPSSHLFLFDLYSHIPLVLLSISLTRFGNGTVARHMARLWNVAHRAKPFQCFRWGGALWAVVVVVAIGTVMLGAIAIAVAVAIALSIEQRYGRGSHRIAANRAEIVLRPMMRLAREQFALLT